MGGRGASSTSNKKTGNSTSSKRFSDDDKVDAYFRRQSRQNALLDRAASVAHDNPSASQEWFDKAIKYMKNSDHHNKDAIIERMKDLKKSVKNEYHELDKLKKETEWEKTFNPNAGKLLNKRIKEYEESVQRQVDDLNSYINRTHQGI